MTSPLPRPTPAALGLVPGDFVRSRLVLPLRVGLNDAGQPTTLDVALGDPGDMLLLDDIQLLTGLRVAAFWAEPDDLIEAIREALADPAWQPDPERCEQALPWPVEAPDVRRIADRCAQQLSGSSTASECFSAVLRVLREGLGATLVTAYFKPPEFDEPALYHAGKGLLLNPYRTPRLRMCAQVHATVAAIHTEDIDEFYSRDDFFRDYPGPVPFRISPSGVRATAIPIVERQLVAGAILAEFHRPRAAFINHVPAGAPRPDIERALTAGSYILGTAFRRLAW
jgi:hypothetical protein